MSSRGNNDNPYESRLWEWFRQPNKRLHSHKPPTLVILLGPDAEKMLRSSNEYLPAGEGRGGEGKFAQLIDGEDFRFGAGIQHHHYPIFAKHVKTAIRNNRRSGNFSTNPAIPDFFT